MYGQAIEKLLVSLLTGLESSKEELERLQASFTKIDVNKDGTLTEEELKQAYQDQWLSSADDIIDQLDVDGDGKISVAEFTQAAIDHHRLLNDEAVGRLFAMFDKDGD